MLNRRAFIRTAGTAVAAAAWSPRGTLGQEPDRNTRRSDVRIAGVQITGGIVVIEADDGTRGQIPISSGEARKAVEAHLARVRDLLVGQNPFKSGLDGEMLWETIYPGKARLYAEGRDPLTGEVIANKPRGGRQTKTGEVFIGLGAVDIALWDLRAKLMKLPAYRLMGKANRNRVPVYWRPGEPKKGLDDARRRAREAFDHGYKYQKWYFMYAAKDGEKGLKDNIELARVLREELGPDARLMFDNHGIRHDDNVEYSVNLCKAVAPYKPFWIEEPICPEHVDGYARIKGETGVTIAGGEHWYTRWPVKAFLDRKCVDYVQSDPVWCGGISEWLKVCELVGQYPGVKVVPHITSPWHVAPHCVASQPEDLCPLLELNVEGSGKKLEERVSKGPGGQCVMEMPDAPGVS